MLTAEQLGDNKDVHVLPVEGLQRKERMAISPKVALESIETTQLVNLSAPKSEFLPKSTIRLDLLRILL